MEYLMETLLRGFEQGRVTRRQLVQRLALLATAASAGTIVSAAAADTKVVEATYINHVSYQVADYARTRDWYADLFGIKAVFDDGKRKANLSIGESLIAVHTRPSPDTPVVDHICFTIANWDQDKSVRETVGAELKRRGLELRPTERSFLIKDPDGFEVQIGGKDQ